MELLEEHRCFDGQQQRWRHHSPVLNCAMTFRQGSTSQFTEANEMMSNPFESFFCKLVRASGCE